MRKVKEFLIYFTLQLFSYCILTVNFRAVAQANIPKSLITDGVNATFSFFVIRRIAKSDDSLVGWLGYVCGSMLGTAIGILVS